MEQMMLWHCFHAPPRARRTAWCAPVRRGPLCSALTSDARLGRDPGPRRLVGTLPRHTEHVASLLRPRRMLAGARLSRRALCKRPGPPRVLARVAPGFECPAPANSDSATQPAPRSACMRQACKQSHPSLSVSDRRLQNCNQRAPICSDIICRLCWTCRQEAAIVVDSEPVRYCQKCAGRPLLACRR